MKIKTSELSGRALDWAVATCEGAENLRENPHRFNKRLIVRLAGRTEYIQDLRFSTDWSQGGPIIEVEGITVSEENTDPKLWSAYIRRNLFNEDGSDCWQTGPTPLIAAMRTFVASRLGNEVDVPEGLL